MFVCTTPVIQILLWVAVITLVYFTAFEASPFVFSKLLRLTSDFWKRVIRLTVFNSLVVAYPFGVIIGDLWLGRFKTVFCGLIITMVAMLVSSIASILQLIGNWTYVNNHGMGTAEVILNIIAAPLFVLGSSVVYSSIIQFGLDQLVDKPSESQGVFVHWIIWAVRAGEVLVKLIFVLETCIDYKSLFPQVFVQLLPFFLFLLLLLLLLIGCCTKHYFNHDGVQYNPYKLIVKVLNFARKNRYPLTPVSTFDQDIKPSRLSYAKERYGGPFKSSDVEDVRQFMSMFVLLLALGPIFILDMPITNLFIDFSRHIGFSVHTSQNITCHHLNPAFFSEVLSFFVIPIYIWIIYSVLQNRRPKIVSRLIILSLLCILALLSMLLIDFIGRTILYKKMETQPQCMFLRKANQSLHYHWIVLIFPGVMRGCFLLLLATGLEFIAAQSPHTMKGFLVGILYALVGIFRLIGIVLYIPFGLDEIWGVGNLKTDPPLINCGFGYYSTSIVIAFIGLIVFVVAIKRYQYRRRDEASIREGYVDQHEDRRPQRRHYQRLGD